jgi:hypothetical protein
VKFPANSPGNNTLNEGSVKLSKAPSLKGKSGNGKAHGKDIARYAEQPLKAERLIPLDDVEMSQF